MSTARFMSLSPRRTALCAWFGIVTAAPLLSCSESETGAGANTPTAVAPGGTASGGAGSSHTPSEAPAAIDPRAPADADEATVSAATEPEPSSPAQPAEQDPQGMTPLDPAMPTEPGAAAGAQGTSKGEDGVTGAAADVGRVPSDPALLSRCTGISPIRCSIDVPNGNYDVSVEVGDAEVDAVTRVSAETRHYAGPALTTTAGTLAVATFTVNVRAEAHDGGQSAPGNVLELLIDGEAPQLHGIGIRPAPSSVTLFIASDSTACDWVSTNASALAPDETGWGQALSMYLEPGVAVANYADSGETSGSFYGKFFPAARDAMKAGDFLLIQFGHNNKSAADIARYEADLERYIADARAKDVTPVIVTPVSRASATAANPGFNGLDQVARDLAAREDIALIDLTALSRTFYTTVPDKNALFIDGTHFHEGGAIAVAGVVAQALKESGLAFADLIEPAGAGAAQKR